MKMCNKKFIEGIINSLTQWVGSINAIFLGSFSLVLFIVGGCIFGFTDTYQLIGNTVMSAVSFLMLFVIQHTQNHDTQALHLKIDELLLKIQSADNKIIGIECLDDEQLRILLEKYHRIAEYYRKGEDL